MSVLRVFNFWMPLAATWLMMSVEGPFVAAIIARIHDPMFNLAAYGVAFSFALIVEAPIIMMMSASTALVADRSSFFQLRRFAYTLNMIITGLMVLLLTPPIFSLIAERLIGLPHGIVLLTHRATMILLPWPAAIGYRRFYQGILIRNNLTRRVAYGTIVRVVTMGLTATAFFFFVNIPGAYIGAAALSMGVTMEAIASRWMARHIVRQIIGDRSECSASTLLTTRALIHFYYPLALTSLLTVGVNPLVTFFLGRSPYPLESLAIWPVVHSFVFAFRSGGVAYQEVGIALLGEDGQGFRPLKSFAGILAAITSGALTIVAFSSLASGWFHAISGLPQALTSFAIIPLRCLVAMPALEVLLSFQRSLLVQTRRTPLITWATTIEVSGIAIMLAIGIGLISLPGALAAAISIVVGRVCANGFLIGRCPRFADHSEETSTISANSLCQ